MRVSLQRADRAAQVPQVVREAEPTLMEAIKKCDFESVKRLLERGDADVNARHAGVTPLMQAYLQSIVNDDGTRVFRLLLDAPGIDIGIVRLRELLFFALSYLRASFEQPKKTGDSKEKILIGNLLSNSAVKS